LIPLLFNDCRAIAGAAGSAVRDDQSKAPAAPNSTTPNATAATELSLPKPRAGGGVEPETGVVLKAEAFPVRFAFTSPKLKLQVMRVR